MHENRLKYDLSPRALLKYGINTNYKNDKNSIKYLLRKMMHNNKPLLSFIKKAVQCLNA